STGQIAARRPAPRTHRVRPRRKRAPAPPLFLRDSVVGQRDEGRAVDKLRALGINPDGRARGRSASGISALRPVRNHAPRGITRTIPRSGGNVRTYRGEWRISI